MARSGESPRREERSGRGDAGKTRALREALGGRRRASRELLEEARGQKGPGSAWLSGRERVQGVGAVARGDRRPTRTAERTVAATGLGRGRARARCRRRRSRVGTEEQVQDRTGARTGGQRLRSTSPNWTRHAATPQRPSFFRSRGGFTAQKFNNTRSHIYTHTYTHKE